MKIPTDENNQKDLLRALMNVRLPPLFWNSESHMAVSRFCDGIWTTFLSVLTRQATLKQIKKNQQKR